MLRLAAIVCVVIAFAATAPTAAHAFDEIPVTPQLRTEALRAADEDPEVRLRKALRDGPYRVVSVEAFDIDGSALVPGAQGQGTAVEILYRAGDGSESLLVRYFPASQRVTVDGHELFVMPGRTTPVEAAVSRPWYWIVATTALLVLVVAGRLPRRTLGIAVPFALIAALFCVQMQNVIPRDHIRGGNAALAGGFVVGLILCAAGALWCARRVSDAPGPSASTGAAPRVPIAVLIVLIAGGLASAAFVAVRMDKPIDVAFASAVGADLMVGGARVYGSTDDIPAVVVDADTYGPVSYLAYAPAALIRDDVRGTVLTSNVAMLFALVAAVAALGRRYGGWRRGLWCAALVVWYPPLALGVATGNNDIIGALLAALLLLVLHAPAKRAALAVAVGLTKYVPLLLLALVLRHRGESRGALTRSLAAAATAGVVLMVIGLHDLEGARVFVERIREAQLERDQLGSFWGLSGWGDLRYVLLGGSVITALAGGWTVWRRGRATLPHLALASCALAFAGLPQFFAPYVSLLVPFAIAAALATAATPGPQVVDDASPARA